MKARLCIVLDKPLHEAARKMMALDCYSSFSQYVEDLVRQKARERGMIGLPPLSKKGK